MRHLKRVQHFYCLLLAVVLLTGCSSDSDTDGVEEGVTEEPLALTSFNMLTNNHTFSVLEANIQPVDSLVVCLFTSVVDYANITPTMAFEGSNIEYRINNETFNPYNATVGEQIDFSYPNIVDFKISNSDDSESTIYRIIVDTEQPILLHNSEITIPDSQVNTTYNGLEIDTWTNVGNYPIRLTLRTTEYKDISAPEAAAGNIFSTTLTKSTDMIYPNEEGQINVFTTNGSVAGSYASTALFSLYFNENLGYIVYDDITNDYVKQIGYKQTELTLKGNLVD